MRNTECEESSTDGTDIEAARIKFYNGQDFENNRQWWRIINGAYFPEA